MCFVVCASLNGGSRLLLVCLVKRLSTCFYIIISDDVLFFFFFIRVQVHLYMHTYTRVYICEQMLFNAIYRAAKGLRTLLWRHKETSEQRCWGSLTGGGMQQ